MDDDGARGERRASRTRLAAVLALTSALMVVEAAAGWLTGSLALLADAGHMLADVLAIAIALAAMRVAEMPATRTKTYGFRRVEILAALANGVVLLVLALAVIVAAAGRLRAPPPIDARGMTAVAAAGLAVNLVSAWLLSKGRANLNVRAAMLHVLADALGSVAVLVAGVVIAATGERRADAVASLLVALVVVWSAWRLLRDAVDVLLEGTPGHIRLADVESALQSVEGVRGVHDLHVWSIGQGFDALSAHVVADERAPEGVLERVCAELRARFGIGHVTVQVERGGGPCRSCE